MHQGMPAAEKSVTQHQFPGSSDVSHGFMSLGKSWAWCGRQVFGLLLFLAPRFEAK